MPENAQDIIQRLRSDPSSYEQASRRENEVWGRQASDDRIRAVREADREAALKLRPGRNRRAFPAIARANGWRFDRGLSLACGGGRAERELMQRGLCKSFVGVDVSDKAIETARAEAAKAGMDIEYRVGDLNTADLGEGLYDLVVTQNCLHHIVELEFLADQINRCLKPGGRLWIHDFVGETQFQWLDKRLEMVNEVLGLLPERYRNFQLHNRVMDRVERRAPGTLISPFEAIRSAEILPVFEQRFDVELRCESDTIMHLVAPEGTRAAYAESEDGVAIFELLMLVDRLLMESGALPPLTGQYVLRKRG